MRGKVFAHYVIRVVTHPRTKVAAAVAYSQSRRVIDFGHCAAPSHNNIILYRTVFVTLKKIMIFFQFMYTGTKCV